MAVNAYKKSYIWSGYFNQKWLTKRLQS